MRRVIADCSSGILPVTIDSFVSTVSDGDAYPDPVDGAFTNGIELPQAMRISLRVYDLAGGWGAGGELLK